MLFRATCQPGLGGGKPTNRTENFMPTKRNAQMKTILLIMLLVCGLAMADECAERPVLRVQYFQTAPFPIWAVVWGPTACTNWVIEVSSDGRTWGSYTGYWGDYFYVCPDTNSPQCWRYIMERQEHRQQFYRLRLAPGVP